MKNNQQSPWISTLGLIIPSIFIAIATILNLYYREALFYKGVNLIYNMQQSSSSILNFIENVFSMLGNPIAVGIVMGCAYIFVRQRIRGIILLTYICGSFFFMAILKQSFQQIRPYWLNPLINVYQWKCPVDFGNPSGHSFIIFALYLPFISDFLKFQKRNILLAIWVVIGVLVVISRMYLGSHSLDQVVLGSLIGLSFLTIYRYWLCQYLYQIYGYLLNQRYRLITFIITTIIWIIYLILPIILYSLNLENRQIDETYINNIQKACNKTVTSQSLQQKMMKDTILSFAALGFIYGFILTKNEERGHTMFMVGLWKFNDTKSIISYLTAAILIVGIPSVLCILVIPELIGAIGGFVFMAIGATYAGFALIFEMFYLQKRYQWITINPQNDTQ